MTTVESLASAPGQTGDRALKALTGLAEALGAPRVRAAQLARPDFPIVPISWVKCPLACKENTHKKDPANIAESL